MARPIGLVCSGPIGRCHKRGQVGAPKKQKSALQGLTIAGGHNPPAAGDYCMVTGVTLQLQLGIRYPCISEFSSIG